MLQIISGKFFGDGERYAFERRGILYSNMSWVRAIETRVGTLEDVDTAGTEVSSYVLSYLNQIEKEPAGGIVRVGDPEIVEQFGWLCMVWFEAFFDGDRQTVVINCREKPAHAGDEYVGSSFAKPYLSPERLITEEVEQGFVRFVDKVIGLPRREYLAVMSFLQTMSHALHVLRQNLDLAYSMLVYALEALGQGRSGYLPRWEDYDPRVRKRLDPVLDGLAPETSEAIRDALLEDAHLKLQQQFVDFTVSHIPDSFFIEDAKRVERPVRRSELEREELQKALLETQDHQKTIKQLEFQRDHNLHLVEGLGGARYVTASPQDRRRIYQALRLQAEVDEEGQIVLSGIFSPDVNLHEMLKDPPVDPSKPLPKVPEGTTVQVVTLDNIPWRG